MMYACMMSVGGMQGTIDRYPTDFFLAVVCGLSFYGNLGFHDSCVPGYNQNRLCKLCIHKQPDNEARPNAETLLLVHSYIISAN